MNTKEKLLLEFERTMYNSVSEAQDTFIQKKYIINNFYNELKRAAENLLQEAHAYADEHGVEHDDEFDNIERFIDSMVNIWLRDFNIDNPRIKYTDGTHYNHNEMLAHTVKCYGYDYWKGV